MKHYYCFFLAALALFSSCADDDGLTTRVQKVSVISFDLNTRDDLTAEGELDSFENVNLTQKEFATYLGQIQDFEINRIAFTFKGVNQSNRSIIPVEFSEINLSLRGMDDHEFQSFFTLERIPFGESISFEIYQKDSVHSNDIEHAVNLIRSKSLQEENLVLNLGGSLPQVISNQNFELELLIDLSAVVGLR